MQSNTISKLQHPKFLGFLSWAILFFSIMCCFSNFNETTLSMFFSSDSVGLPCIYKDLMLDGGNIKDWYFAAAPTVFPDILVYFLLAKVFSLNLTQGVFFYAIVQVSAVVALCSYIYKRSVPEYLRKYSWFIPLIFSTFFMECFYFSHDILFVVFLSEYSYHLGAFVCALISLSVYLSAWPNWIKYVFLFLFSIISTFSDMLFVVMFSAPFIVVSLFTISRDTLWRNLILILLIILGTLTGMKLYQYVLVSGVSHFLPPHKLYDFNNILPSFQTFIDQVWEYLKIPGFRSVIILLTLLLIPIVLFRLVRMKSDRGSKFWFFMMYFVAFSLSVFFAPIINGNYTGYDTMRYCVSPFFFMIPVLTVFLGSLIEKNLSGTTNRTIASYSLPVLFVILISVKYNNQRFNDFFEFYPKKVGEIDAVCKKYDLKNGISDYWTAKWTTMFSKNKVMILAMHPDVYLNELGSNIEWYYSNEFDFVVANHLDSANISNFFKIKDTIKTENYDILLVDKYFFKRGEYRPYTK